MTHYFSGGLVEGTAGAYTPLLLPPVLSPLPSLTFHRVFGDPRVNAAINVAVCAPVRWDARGKPVFRVKAGSAPA